MDFFTIIIIFALILLVCNLTMDNTFEQQKLQCISICNNSTKCERVIFDENSGKCIIKNNDKLNEEELVNGDTEEQIIELNKQKQ